MNQLATHRLREARQLGRDKQNVTDSQQIAELLRRMSLLPRRASPEPDGIPTFTPASSEEAGSIWRTKSTQLSYGRIAVQ